MQIITQTRNNIRIAEIHADGVLIHTIEDSTDVLAMFITRSLTT